MRNLTAQEIEQALDDNGESEEGCVAIEATVQELADLNAGTCCGGFGNLTFKALADKGYGKRKCRGWYDAKPVPMTQADWESIQGEGEVPADAMSRPEVVGMFHIKIQTDKTAEKVERIAASVHGSLRFNGDSMWDGYKEFEIE